jgi:hypothetical protein
MVRVRFQPRLGRSVELLTSRIKRGPYHTPELLPDQYFNASYTKVRQAKLAKVLIPRLQKEFPADMLRFERAADVAPQSKPITPTVPTLTIRHTTVFTGAATLRKTRAVYVPIAVHYRTTFEIPADSEPLVLKFDTATRPDLQKIANESLSAKQIYERMTDRCDARFITMFFRALLDSEKGEKP